MTKLCAQTLCAKGKMKTLQSTIIPSNVGIIYPLSRHIIHQDIFSRIVGMIYPIPTKASNCVKCPKLFDFISIRISKCLFSIPAHRNCPTYIHPPRDGMIYPMMYPIPTYILPKLLAVYIQYKSYISKTYILTACPRTACNNCPKVYV